MRGGEQQPMVPRGPAPGWRDQAGLCGLPQSEILALVVAFHNPVRTWGSPLRPQGVSKETELRFFLFVQLLDFLSMGQFLRLQMEMSYCSPLPKHGSPF